MQSYVNSQRLFIHRKNSEPLYLSLRDTAGPEGLEKCAHTEVGRQHQHEQLSQGETPSLPGNSS